MSAAIGCLLYLAFLCCCEAIMKALIASAAPRRRLNIHIDVGAHTQEKQTLRCKTKPHYLFITLISRYFIAKSATATLTVTLNKPWAGRTLSNRWPSYLHSKQVCVVKGGLCPNSFSVAMSAISTALAAPALAVAALALIALALLLVLFVSITLIVQSSSTRPRDHAVYLSRQPYWVFVLLSRMLYWASLFSRLKPAPLRVAEVAVSCIHSQVSSVCV